MSTEWLSTLVNTALAMSRSESEQIAAQLLFTYGPTTRGNHHQLGDILQ